MADPLMSHDIRSALRTRWPDTDYLTIDEAPDGPARMGRKLDMIAVSMWKSRGFSVDGVEIKVSVSDFRREIKEPAKADWWWAHCDRFWLAVPAALAGKVKDETPGTWGILACSAGKVRVVRQAPKHDRVPFTWPETIGLMRASADAGVSSLQRAENRGYTRGVEAAELRAKQQDPESRAREQLDEIHNVLEIFREVSGQRMRSEWDARRFGEMVRIMCLFRHDPALIVASLTRLSRNLTRASDEVRGAAESLSALAPPALDTISHTLTESSHEQSSHPKETDV